MKRKLMKKVSQITDDLEPGEQIVEALRAAPDGELARMITGAAGGVTLGMAGLIVGTKVGDQLGKEARENAEAAGVQTKGPDVMIVLTDRRLLVYQLGMTGKPKEQVGVIPRTEIADMTEGELRIFGQRMPALEVKTTSGASVAFGVAKIRRSDLAAFLQGYRASKGNAEGPPSRS